MAELFRRGKRGTWSARFTDPNGREIFRSTGTTNEAEAREWLARLKSALYRTARLGEKPRRSWREASVQWLQTRAHKATIEKDRANLRWLDRYLGKLYLDDIGPDLIASIGAARLAEPADKRAGATSTRTTSPATANRTLALLRSILVAARDEWQWIASAPPVKLFDEPERDVPEISRELADRVIAAMPEHLRAPAVFALATGLREQNVLRLEWSRVDIDRAACWIPGSKAKARKPIGVPLNSDALAVLRGQAGKSAAWVFPSPKGDFPMARANNTAFRNARAAAGVPWLRWHDLRHAWATWHAQSGTPAMVLAELGAWSTLRMVQRYSHFSTAHLAEHAERIAKSGSRAVQNPGKSKKAMRTTGSKTARKPRRC